jgi:CheY-like chemotaxis protein
VGGLKSLQSVRVLVVDDDEDSREMIRVALELEGASATCVAGAHEALQQIHSAPFNVVVSDLNMPGEDGHAFLRKVRALPRDRGGRIPAVALTALTTREARVASREAGFHYHLDKPVDTRKLIQIVESLARPARG